MVGLGGTFQEKDPPYSLLTLNALTHRWDLRYFFEEKTLWGRIMMLFYLLTNELYFKPEFGIISSSSFNKSQDIVIVLTLKLSTEYYYFYANIMLTN
ncbi:hypothetical protein D0T60_16315 [Bacteroides sp. 224]|nr:hypothetical protein [Bacteroides sp. 224]